MNVNGGGGGGDDFLQDLQPLHTATLDRITYRGNSRKSGHQTDGKYSQSNGVECRRYHTLGKASTTHSRQRSRLNMSGTMNGNALSNSYSVLVNSPSKKSNYYANTADSLFYRTNGTGGPVDEVERNNECCDSRRDLRPARRRVERLPIKSSRNGANQNYNEEKARRGQTAAEKKNAQEPIYEVIATKSETKREPRVERRRDRHSRRPHSAPVLDANRPVDETNHRNESKKCGHRNRKPAPPPLAYQDPTVAPLPKRRFPPPPATSVLEVENNNKIILKVR